MMVGKYEYHSIVTTGYIRFSESPAFIFLKKYLATFIIELCLSPTKWTRDFFKKHESWEFIEPDICIVITCFRCSSKIMIGSFTFKKTQSPSGAGRWDRWGTVYGAEKIQGSLSIKMHVFNQNACLRC